MSWTSSTRSPETGPLHPRGLLLYFFTYLNFVHLSCYSIFTFFINSTRSESRKIFVGGLNADITDREFGDHFSKFGIIKDASVMLDRTTQRSRGFGFITFETEEAVDKVLSSEHEIRGKWVEVKRAEPRDAQESFGGRGGFGGGGRGGGRDGGRGGRGYGRGDEDNSYGYGGAMGGRCDFFIYI